MIVQKLIDHVEEYVARYTVLLLAVLTPAAGLLGSLAADLGGSDTSAGRAVLAGASALTVAAGGVVFLKNLGGYQQLRDFGATAGEFEKLLHAAKAIGPMIESSTRPVSPPDEDPVAGVNIGRVGPGQAFPSADQPSS